jgi:hypothetical protein
LSARTTATPPAAATYTLVAEKASLRPLFDDLPRGSTIVTCPGNIQSPGPWRRNATPQQVSGTLVYSDGLAAVTWTPEANLLVSHADRAGPALNQLNQWWSAHSRRPATRAATTAARTDSADAKKAA